MKIEEQSGGEFIMEKMQLDEMELDQIAGGDWKETLGKIMWKVISLGTSAD